jgi:DNA-binding transcriptional MerR regulator
MSETYENPIFNLRSVVRETGVKPDTLRVWERRYGLPRPARTEGGHRIYSQRDIDTVRWLLARQQEGLRIKGAVELWHSLEADRRDPLQSQVLAPREATGHTVAELRQEWVSACVAYDERRAERTLTQAFALYPPEVVCLELLQEGIATIGRGWYDGDVTVQQEHFASALAMRRLEALLLAAPPPTRSGRILSVCPPEENHTFGLLLLTLLLRRNGWETLYLGANVPIARLEDAIRTTRPALVISTALQLPTAATMLEMAHFLESVGIPLGFGGGIFNQLPALQERIPGHYLGEDLVQAARTVQTLMTVPGRTPIEEAVPETYRQALAHYRARQLYIETDLATHRPDLARESWFLTASRELGCHIAAALALGDVDYLDASIGWLQGLGRGQYVSGDALSDYLHSYRRAAEAHLDERGAVVTDWLARFA